MVKRIYEGKVGQKEVTYYVEWGSEKGRSNKRNTMIGNSQIG